MLARNRLGMMLEIGSRNMLGILQQGWTNMNRLGIARRGSESLMVHSFNDRVLSVP
jgi:hypothetical protein